MVASKPEGVVASFPYLCNAFVSYKQPPEDLEIIFRNILQGFKVNIGAQWDEYFNAFPEDLKNELIQRFNL